MSLLAAHLVSLQLSLSCCWALSCHNTETSADFSLPGDYLLAGLFPLHSDCSGVRRQPTVTLCDRPNSFNGHGYHLFQAMRFGVEEINNSTALLPNVTLGYELYDVCSESANVYATLNVLSLLGTRHVEIQADPSHYSPAALAVIGPDTTNHAATTAALLSPFLVPLISYEASSMTLGMKRHYPSFLRTIPNDKYQVETMVLLLQRFGWIWISVVGSDGDYGQLGVQALEEQATQQGICVAFKDIIPFSARPGDRRMQSMMRHLARARTTVVVVFSNRKLARVFFESVVLANLTAKLLEQIRKVNFLLHEDTVMFHDNGDPLSGYDIIAWDWSGPNWTSRVIGSSTWPPVQLDINETKIRWHGKDNQVPTSVCSSDCLEGHQRVVVGFYHCCFECVPCDAGTFLNKSALHRCQPCGKEEWAPVGSETCFPRTVVFLTWHEPVSWGLLAANTLLLLLVSGTTGLFAWHLDTPVVRSAGGRLCFFMLGSLAVASCGLYGFFGEPTLPTCLLRQGLFALGFAVFLSCLTIRSFQLVFIFKFSAKVPTFYHAWVQNHGPGLFVVISSTAQLLICLTWLAVWTPLPTREYQRFPQLVVLDCTEANSPGFMVAFAYNGLLSVSAFACSYLGKDLPENYNEAKCVTFSLLLNFVSWIAFFTTASVYQGKYLPAVHVLAALSSLSGGFSGYFLPKCYVILCRPDLNSTEHFQASIQEYTSRYGST
ncbi:taste receptor type 1 member 1 isoform X2 [Hyaena hyaena]|uniref:taste receptor type 1 member 1 isoform X2 n=1 Tax=Hyaena hyaena TaxID=95912 RepID=UPI001920C808|nr:taste receptor type 1 member 1 isoform X2 [Hyaena hyaena]